MDVKDVTGKRFATGRPGSNRDNPRYARMLGEVVVDDEDVPAGFHEVFGDAGRGIGGDVGKSGRVVTLDDDDDGVFHRAFSRRLATTLATEDALGRWAQ